MIEFRAFWSRVGYNESRCREENCDHSFEVLNWACARGVTSDRERAYIAANW
jgi:hypothetical protein